MMPDNSVETHYTRHDLGEIILAALKKAGKDVDHLTPDDLAPVDEFHGGQRPATIRLAELVGFTGTERVLDVGSGARRAVTVPRVALRLPGEWRRSDCGILPCCRNADAVNGARWQGRLPTG